MLCFLVIIWCLRVNFPQTSHDFDRPNSRVDNIIYLIGVASDKLGKWMKNRNESIHTNILWLLHLFLSEGEVKKLEREIDKNEGEEWRRETTISIEAISFDSSRNTFVSIDKFMLRQCIVQNRSHSSSEAITELGKYVHAERHFDLDFYHMSNRFSR